MNKPKCKKCKDTGQYRVWDYDQRATWEEKCNNLPSCTVAREDTKSFNPQDDEPEGVTLANCDVPDPDNSWEGVTP